MALISNGELTLASNSMLNTNMCFPLCDTNHELKYMFIPSKMVTYKMGNYQRIKKTKVLVVKYNNEL